MFARFTQRFTKPARAVVERAVVRADDRVSEAGATARCPLGRRRRGPRVTRAAKQALELSLREAISLRHNYIGTEHVLLGLVRGGDAVISESLRDAGVSYDTLRDGVRDALRRAG